MRSSDEVYYQIRFKPNGMDFRFESDKAYFQKFSKRHAGKKGYIIVCIGKIEKSVRQLRFFFGPLIDAYIRLTGDADKTKWKEYLKDQFLDRDEPYMVPSLGDISMRRMSRFIQRCVDNLIDQGGHLDQYEKRELDEFGYVEAIAPTDPEKEENHEQDR